MTRGLLTALFLVCAAGLMAQLRVGADAGAGSPMQSPARALTPQLGWTHPVGWPSMTFPGTRGPAPLASTSSGYGSPAFDFAATKPYLAFFCRLELNIEEATRFPVRFRLGEVRGWQQELGRRD